MRDTEQEKDPARAILAKLLNLHDMEVAAAKGGANYEHVRSIVRERAATWEAARELIDGPREVDNKPHTRAEAKRWKAREKLVKASREPVKAA